MGSSLTEKTSPLVKKVSRQFYGIENADAGDHIEDDSGQGEPSISELLRLLQKSSSQDPGNGNQTAKNRSSPSNSNIQNNISHELLKRDPAFNPAKLSGHETPSTRNVPRGSKSLQVNAVRASKSITRSVLHPRRAIIQHYQSKTAKRLSKATRPYLTSDADQEFLAEYDALLEAEYSQATGRDRTQQRANRMVFDDGITQSATCRGKGDKGVKLEDDPSAIDFGRRCELQREKVELLEAHRQGLLVAWITSRYIKRVRSAPWPRTQCPEFNDECFIERGDNKETRFRWDKYIAEVSRDLATTKYM